MGTMTKIGSVALLTMGAAGSASAAQPDAGLIDGGSLDFSAVNYYLNRDFRDGQGQGKREEWAQGFFLSAKSGYTPGLVGFGVDLLGMSNLKLDGIASEEGTGLLPTDGNGARRTLYRLGVTGKARISDTDLLFGMLIPKQPLIKASVSRVMPQTFQGSVLESKDIPGLDLQIARYTSSWYRDGTQSVPMTLSNKNVRFAGTPNADAFDMFSAQYMLGKHLDLRYQVGYLQQIYRQQVFNLTHKVALGNAQLRNELRYFVSDEDGDALAGRVDNHTAMAMTTLTVRGQEFGLGYQEVGGPTAMPWLGGTDGDVFNWTFINDFLERDERSWQARYRINGDKAGLPGWSFLLRYVNGDHARPANIVGEGREWQRDVEVVYAFQSGWLNHFSVRYANATLRSNYQRDADDNRVTIRYELPLFGDGDN